MPRLFTGLALPLELTERLASLCTGLPGARWLPPDLFHITLHFVGDVEAHLADEFAARLDDIEIGSFTVQIAGLGSFGGAKPHTLWAGVEAGAELRALHQAHERAARLAGLPTDGRKFAPHVTLARIKGVKPAPLARFLEANAAFWSPPFELHEFLLYSARPGTGGGPYVVEERYPLLGRI